MRCAVNPPCAFPEYDLGAYSYGLAHEAQKSSKYLHRLCELGRNPDRYLVLDNGADELGEGLGGDVFRNLIDTIQPDEIILPDVLFETQVTIERGKQFLKLIPSLEKKPRVMAVVQGTEYADWMHCYTTWANDDRVDVVGIPYDIEFETNQMVVRPKDAHKSELRGWRRIDLIKHLEAKGLLTKEIHLLGMNNLQELRWHSVNDHSMIQRNDTTAPFAAALDGKKWVDGWSGNKDWKALDFKAEGKFELHLDFVQYNLAAYFAACNDVEGLMNLLALK